MALWKAHLARAARTSRARCDSLEAIGEDQAHGETLTALLLALAAEPSATLLVEPRTPDRPATENARPADILVLHPELGCLLVEVKAWSLSAIKGVEAGTVFFRASGMNEAHNPWKQAQDAMGQIQSAIRRLPKIEGCCAEAPFLDKIVAFPNIDAKGWQKEGYHTCVAESDLLLSNELADPAVLWAKLKRVVQKKARASAVQQPPAPSRSGSAR